MREKVSQITRDLRWFINSGVWSPSEKVPSENAIAIKMGCSRMTARKALVTLKSEGLLISRKGRGYFVSMGHEKLTYTGKNNEVFGSYQFHKVDIGIDKQSRDVFSKLGINPDKKIFNYSFLKTQFDIKGEAFTVLHSNVNTKLLPNITSSEIKNSFAAFLSKRNVKVKKRIEQIMVIDVPQPISIKLRVTSGQRVVASYSLMLDENDSVIECAVRYTLPGSYSEKFEKTY